MRAFPLLVRDAIYSVGGRPPLPPGPPVAIGPVVGAAGGGIFVGAGWSDIDLNRYPHRQRRLVVKTKFIGLRCRALFFRALETRDASISRDLALSERERIF